MPDQYKKLWVKYIDHGGSFSANDEVILSYAMGGPTGSTGSAGSAGSAGATGAAGLPGPEVVFSAHPAANNSPGYCWEKLNQAIFDNEKIDSAGNYDVSNSRFTPTTAGKYYLHARLQPNSPATGSPFGTMEVLIVKNANPSGTVCDTAYYLSGPDYVAQGTIVSAEDGGMMLDVAGIAEANGTTDFFEVWFRMTNVTDGGSEDLRIESTFDGFLINQGAQGATGPAGGGLANVVEDTTPQLGGSLDVNSNKIVSISNGNIELEPHGTGKIDFDGFMIMRGGLIPDTDNAYDIGSAEYKIRDLYVSQNSLHIGDATLSEENVDRSMEITPDAPPASPTDAGKKGDVRVDATHAYICTDTDTWKRISLETAW